MSKFVNIIIGGAEIAVGLYLEFVTFGASTPLTASLIVAGIGTVIAGVGTLLAKGPLSGTGGSTRNPIAPWTVVYGRAKVGGTIVYLSEFDDNNKYLDVVIVLASHVCKSVDALLFDSQRIRLDANGCSFTPTQQTIGISSISRSNGIVTVVTASAVTDLETADFMYIRNVSGDATLNGKYSVTVETSTRFTYVCGGSDGTYSSDGEVKTAWADYRAKVHMEVLLGDHTATFPGMLTGTPYDGDPGDLVTRSDNPWTANHKLLGKCCVFLRLHYNDEVFANGLPTINFRLSGKDDIYDPRSSPAHGYTENAALCIADFLSNTTWGFKAVYGTEIPTAELIAAANICDEDVPLAAGGTEPRYTANGMFPLSMKRGEILQNLLTACGGRLTYVGGQFIIHPAACVEPSIQIPLVPPSTAPITHMYFTSLAARTANNQDFTNYGTPQSSWNIVTIPSGPQTPSLSTVTSYVYDLTAYLPVDRAALAVSWALVYSGGTVDAGNPSGGWTPETWEIFDAYIDIVRADGSTERWGWVDSDANQNGFSSGQVVGDKVERWHFSNLSDPAVLTLSNFTSRRFLTDASPPADDAPDLSVSGMAGSSQALALTAGPFRWKQKLPIRDLFNGVKGTYISPSNNWQSSDIPPYAQDELHGYSSDANMIADGGDRRWKDIQLPFTIFSATAQRLAKIELLRIRHQGTGTFIFNMALYQVTALDVILMDLPILGWHQKQLEVSAHRFTLNRQQVGGAEVTLLGTEIDVQETDCSIYDWSPSEELTAHGFQQATLPSNVGTLDGIVTKVNAQTGTTYTLVQSDRGQLVTFTNSSPVAVTLTEAGTLSGQLDELWSAYVTNNGTGAVTITASGGQTIDGSATLVLQAGQGAHIFSDGSNFYTLRSGTSAVFVDDETPAVSSPPGTVFTLAHAPNPAASLQLYVNGVHQIVGTDYTLATLTITFTNAPDSDDIIRAFYRY